MTQKMQNVHQSVLLNEAIEGLKIKEGDCFLDATLGGGGHSAEVARMFGQKVFIVGLDLDPTAIERAKAVLKPFSQKFALRVANFRHLDQVLDEVGKPLVDEILFDLGLSSNELELSGKGFSFQKDEPLNMRYGTTTEGTLTAEEIVNRWQENNLADVIYGYGEERLSRRIAKAIVEARKKRRILTTFELLAIIENAVPFWYKKQKLHFATRTFQALRIAVNDELGALSEGLSKGFERLQIGGRMAVISFHSLEDRIVKEFFKKMKEKERGILVTKKPIVAEREETLLNPRSRSAKLRIIEKINEDANIKTE